MTRYVGKVYDLDFIDSLGYCQALIRDKDENIVVVTTEHRMQSILETAMIMSQDVEVYYEVDNNSNTNRLTRVKLNLG